MLSKERIGSDPHPWSGRLCFHWLSLGIRITAYLFHNVEIGVHR